jgi:hypothetical protein
MRQLVRYLLKNRMQFQDDWTMQGFGFLRLKISDSMRLHVWDSRLREAGVSDIHDHTQWAFTSHIISGSLVNIRYEVCQPTCDNAQPYNMATLKCGIGGGMIDGSTKLAHLLAGKPELYLPGSSYRQEPDEVHRTMPADGTVTLIEQERRDVDTARVFWPIGGTWGDAIPRQATKDEVANVGSFALSIFGDA